MSGSVGLQYPIHRLAYRTSDAIATILTRRGAFAGLRSNLAVAHGFPIDSTEIDALLTANVRNALRCYVDLLAISASGSSAVDQAFLLESIGLEAMRNHMRRGRGVVFVGAHMSSFDVLLQALSRQVPSMQLLSKPVPGLNTRLINRIRGKYGLRITPLSAESLREAVDRLRGGGVVGMAADVPAVSGARLAFFGRPCSLAIGHARLALSTGAAMVVGVSQRLGPGRYRGLGVECPRPQTTGDKREDAILWSQAAIDILERYIAERPQEWFLPPPLWPILTEPTARPRLPATQPG
jgi:KDO2-lipid IV(A) lauroyltransferase